MESIVIIDYCLDAYQGLVEDDVTGFLDFWMIKIKMLHRRGLNMKYESSVIFQIVAQTTAVMTNREFVNVHLLKGFLLIFTYF